MTCNDKLKQFFEQLPVKPTSHGLKEAVAKTGDVTDIADVVLAYANAHKLNTSELQGLAKAKQQTGQSEPSAVIKIFSDIKPEKIKWLWENRIAIGKLTIFAGDPGLGKSQGSLDMAARLSRGTQFPDGSPGMTGDTILLTTEDDPGDTMRPRLDALNADVSRIHLLQGERTKEGHIAGMTLEKITTFLSAVNQIREQGHEVKILIIDPLNGFMGDGDSNKSEDTRKAADAICFLAEREGFAIVGIMHLNKGKGPPMTRVLGSIAWVAKARAAYFFMKDKETDRRLFLPLKNNLGPDVGGMQYSIQVRSLYNGGIEAPYISWEGTATDDLSNILYSENRQGKERPTPEQDEIVNLLREAAPLPMVSGEIADKLGKSKATVSNALGRLTSKGLVNCIGWGKYTLPDNSENKAQKTLL
jgi:DNA-binding CsgD family transcriptional regulator